MTPHEVLVAARELIADERNWIKGATRVMIDGRVCHCTYGAVVSIVKDGHEGFNIVWDLLDRIAEDMGKDGAIEYNDAENTTHADVLAMFDRAIAATGERAS